MRGARAATSSLVALLALSLSCGGERTDTPAAQQAALGGDIAARVGTDTIPVSLVAKVAAAQHITPREALARLLDDAICASAARARGLDRDAQTSWLLTAARGKNTADRLHADAVKEGPPTDAEILELTKQYWREVDRPPAVRVVHVVARKTDLQKKPDPAADARAHALAPAILAAVSDAKDDDDFLTKAKAVPHPDVEVVAERLPSFAEDGLFTEGFGQMDLEFTKHAFTLTTPGATTGVVESPFGWHVIRLVERIPEARMGLEARRLAFVDEAYMIRAHTAVEARLQALKGANKIEILPSAENLMRSLRAPASPGAPPAQDLSPKPAP